jgi:hypothetical protein
MEQIIIALLPSMAKKLAEYFLDKRRNSVTIKELQDQILQLLEVQRGLQIEATQARLAIMALTRYLALTQQETFLLRGGSLELAAGDRGKGRALVEPAIRDFSHTVQARIERQNRRSTRLTSVPKNRATISSATPVQRTVSPEESKALGVFFEGFEEEIMRTRLGGNN